MISEKQIDELQKPFTLVEHGFNQKNPYILKSAIRARLNRITPGWQLLPPELMAVDGDVVVMRGAIQIGDIKRYGVGTGPILRADKNGVVFNGAKLMGMIAKAYKTAASDILPRAALEFGLGEYLKNKPKSIDEDNFAPWLAKLTAVPVDPNTWTIENIREWGNKWRATGLNDNQLFKALNITDKWSNFKGTVAEADKAVQAFIAISALDAPATTKTAAASTVSPTRLIDCPTHLLETGDVIIQTYKTAGSGPATVKLEVLEQWGKMGNGYKLKLKNLDTEKEERVHWAGALQTLCDGPKVQAFAADPDACVAPRGSGHPVWNRQIAAPV